VTAAIWYYFYCAIRHPERMLTWLVLGIAAGLAMLTKYSAILVLASVFVYVVWERLWSNPLVIRGLLISILVFFIIISPHLQWLVDNNWQPFSYLNDELNISVNRLTALGEFLTGQALRFWYLFAIVLFLYKTTARKPQIINILQTPHGINHQRFLLIILCTPLVLALLPLFVKGGFLSRNWVTAFFLPTGILLVKYVFCDYDENKLLQNTRRVVWTIQPIILLIFLSVIVFIPLITGYAIRTNFPGQLLAEKASAIWYAHQKQPLTIVIADTWVGGNILLHTSPEPTLLIDNDPSIAHWVSRQDVANCGALVVITAAEKVLPNYSALFSQAINTGTLSLPWGHGNHGEIAEYGWAILPPEPHHNNCQLTTD
jgi:4-amino-4-deoxy-L-arabinose transferase-like glycosyltransferase